MVGSIVQAFHGELDVDNFLKNTFTNNGVLVALAPGDGLMLEKVSYDRYNQDNASSKNAIMIQRVSQTQELNEYREMLVSHIAQRELKSRSYIAWLSWFDDNCQDHYITPPSLERIREIRNNSK